MLNVCGLSITGLGDLKMLMKGLFDLIIEVLGGTTISDCIDVRGVSDDHVLEDSSAMKTVGLGGP